METSHTTLATTKIGERFISHIWLINRCHDGGLEQRYCEFLDYKTLANWQIDEIAKGKAKKMVAVCRAARTALRMQSTLTTQNIEHF